jgi:transcriptional regulator with XRE-family HTH domain
MKLHISQKNLAKMIGLQPKQLSFIENNIIEPTISQLELVSDVLNIPITYFLTDITSKMQKSAKLQSIERRLRKLAVTISKEATNNMR